MWALAQLPRLLKTPKRVSNINPYDSFFKTLDKISSQPLKRLVVSMPKRHFQVNCEKLSLH